MKRMVFTGGFFAMALVAIAMLAGAGTNRANMPDGKSLFVANSCNTCHSVTAQGVQKTGQSTAPDLSGVGLKHNADWITQYLNKTVEMNGKKHMKKWKGTPADLTTVATWLAAQKKK